MDKNFRSKFESETSGGEEVSNILNEAKKIYGRVQSFRQAVDQANISQIQPQTLPTVVSQQFLKTKVVNKKDASHSESSQCISSSDVQNDIKVDNKIVPKHYIKRRKIDPEKSLARKSETIENEEEDTVDNEEKTEENGVNLRIPTSDTTDVVIKLKHLNQRDVKDKRIHVKVNEKRTPKSKSQRIVYGSKSLLAHHLRKSRPPLFSRKLPTPKLDKKQVLRKAMEEITNNRNKDIDHNDEGNDKFVNKALETKLEIQKAIRNKRTENAQLRRLLQKT